MHLTECVLNVFTDRLVFFDFEAVDPDAPNYDSSKDEEFAEYMCIQK